MSNVQKIKYSVSRYDFSVMKYATSITATFLPDGSLNIKHYAPGSRKVLEIEKHQLTPETFNQLYADLRQCIDKANTIIQYVDDSDAELSIFYFPQRTETMPRGLGNEDQTVGSIFTELVARYSDKW